VTLPEFQSIHDFTSHFELAY